MNRTLSTIPQLFSLPLQALIWSLILMGLILTGSNIPAWAADHLEAPMVSEDGRTDINDVYIFHPGDPQNLRRTVIAITVNPAAGMSSPTRFSENAVYDLLVDQDGDAVEDLIFRTTFFSSDDDSGQDLVVQMIEPGVSAEILAQGKTETLLGGKRTSRVFAGLRDDPFFFDLNGFNAGAEFCFGNGTGNGFFEGLNVSAIVIEVPNFLLGSGQIGLWGVTRA